MQQEHAVPAIAAPAAEQALRKRPNALQNILKFVRRKPLGAIGFAMIIFLFAMTLGTPKAEFGVPKLPHRPLGFEVGQPWMSRYVEERQFKDHRGRWLQEAGPSWQNWLGTDDSGRDNWSRVVWGARRSLYLAIWARG